MDKISKSFEKYVETVSQVGIDITFWNSFLKTSVVNFQKENIQGREILSSLFAAYDIDITSNSGFLKVYDKTKSISSNDLEEYRVNFFSWVINGGLVKVYIAVEIVLFETIWDRDFADFPNPVLRRKNMTEFQSKIEEKLRQNRTKYEIKNNRYLIEYLLLDSKEYRAFLAKPIRVDLKTTWKEFYELFSILRNIFSHVGSKVDNDILNEIRRNAKDIFERHFLITENLHGDKYLFVVQEKVGDFLDLINDFTLNTIKIARNESNFEFLKMKRTY